MDTDMQLALSWRADQVLPDNDNVSSLHHVISGWIEGLSPYK